MTSKERILTALRCRQPDMVPVSMHTFGEYHDDWKSKNPSYHNLIKFLKENADCFHPWGPKSKDEAIFLSSAREIRKKVNSYVKDGTTFTETIITTPKGILKDLTKIEPNIHTVWRIEHFLKTYHCYFY